MIFDSDYWNSLNRKEREEVTLNPKQLGYSLGGDPLQNLKTGIFTGTGQMELTFFNAPGKGQKKDTPESWGKTERQEMKELARVNEVEVTVHATPNMGGGGASFSGFTGQGFSDEARQKAVDEMRRTADFASDINENGGPVVLHIDGFQRPVYTAGVEEGAKPNVFERPVYKEEIKHPLAFVDEKTGNVVQVSKEQKIAMPVAKKNGEYVIEDGVPKVEILTFDEVEKRYNKLPKEEKDTYKNPLNYFYNQLQTGQIEELKARRQDYMQSYEALKRREDNFRKQLKYYERFKKENYENPERAKQLFTEKLIQEKSIDATSEEDLETFQKDPVKYVEGKINDYKNRRTIFEEGAVGQSRMIEQEQEKLNSYVDITSYSVEKEADTIAQSAMEALAIEKKKKLKKPLWIAPENWMVETYGSHPKEYRNIIEKSREAMAQKLITNKKMSPSKAKKVAEDHIRGTFDIGHLNMWKKYYKGDDKGFAKWMESNLRPLIRDKIIGHVHLSDNFGFHDEHIELGEGNAPLQEFFRVMKEEGFEGTAVAEPGGQREGQLHRVWTSALSLGGSPVYRIDSTAKTWTDVEGSYFGRTQSPTFLVGDYAPSKDWTLWSEVPFE